MLGSGVRAGAGLDALTHEDALFSDSCANMAPALFLGGRRITTATSNLGNLGDATETGRNCATGAPHCHPLTSLICVPSRGREWGGPRPRGWRH